MSAYAFIPLIAAIAYIPLFIVLLYNRPWDRKRKLFFIFLIAAVAWSISTLISMTGLLSQDKTLEVRIVLSIAIWMPVQLHYFVASFYRSEPTRIPFAYLFVVATVVLAALGRIPAGIQPTATGTVIVNYGPWIILIGLLFLATVGVRDIYSLIQRYRLSTDPEERNQIVYLIASIAVLGAFLLSSYTPRGGEYPVSHIGNLGIACILTYAVVAHRLLDFGVVFRRAFINIVLYGTGVILVSLLFWLGYEQLNDVGAALAIALAAGIPFIAFLVHKVYPLWQARVEGAFVGAKFRFRRQLSQFITRIHDAPDLKVFGNEFTSLLAQSVDCRRACLLLPQSGDEAFVARFSYPPADGNPIQQLRLAPDSPVIDWLRRENTILHSRNLAILPEFQSVWEEERQGIQSAEVHMLVPLTHRGDLAAIFAISERRDGKPYAVEDIDLVESIAGRVAASLEKEYYHEQLEEQDREITLLNRLTMIVTSSVSVDSIFEGFVEALKEVVDFDWATIALIEGNEIQVLALSSTVGSPWQKAERIPLGGTATEWVCRERKSLYEPDLGQYRRFWTGEFHLKQGVRSIVYLPLTIKDQSIGSLVIASRKPGAFDVRQRRLLEQVAMQIATPIENSQLYARAEQRSRVDELTGLFNRRHFEERLKEEISRHSRYGDAFSVILLDLDNFKTYNDIYGHPSGDLLLNEIGSVIKRCIRTADQAFRYGGDEFVVILPHTASDDAQIVAERVREGVAEEMQKKEIAVTCSIGLAGYPSDGVMSGELVNVADTALYFAKRTGGDRVYLPSKMLSEPVEDSGTHARRNGLSAIYALVSTVEARDPYTYGHSRKVNTYAVALAEAIGLSPDEVSRVSTAALLHDIGKIGVPDKVLNKKGKLSEEDWEAIRSHPRLGATIVGNVPNLVPCISSILHHHERWDGSGYPEALRGEEISIEARILALADSFEAMTAARPYRPALCLEKVIKELRRCAGSQFDPELTEAFIRIIEAGLPEKVKIGQESSRDQTGV